MPRSSPRFSAASEAVSPPTASKDTDKDLDYLSDNIDNGESPNASSRRLFVGVGNPSNGTASSAKSPAGRGVTSSGSTAIITHIRHALDESTRCMSLHQPPGKSDGSGFGYVYSTGSTAPLSCPAGYLSYSPFRRRWEVYYRNTLTGAGNTGFAISSTPTIVAHAHRITSNQRDGEVASPSDYRMKSLPMIQADDGTVAPPPKVLQTTLRLIELRRMMELVVAQVSPSGSASAISSRVQTRQMTIISLESALSDLLEHENGKSDEEDEDRYASSPMQSMRYVKLLRSASVEAIRKALALPIECSVGDDTNDAYMWRVVLADSYEAQLGPRSGELSPTTCQCNDDQIRYVQKFVKDCLALDRIVDMTIEGGYVQRKRGIDGGAYFGRAASSPSSADDDSDSSSDVQIIEGPAIAAPVPAPSVVAPVPETPIPAPSPPVLSLTSTGRRPKRMRESVRRSPSLDGSMIGSRDNETAATVAVTTTIAKKKPKSNDTTAKSPGRVSPSLDRTGKNIQLYASTLGTPQADQGRCEAGRPKRKIKQVIRFNADPIPYKVQRSAAEMAKSGDGFNCPACMAVVSYDATQCPSCQLRCQYAPGAGVQIIKDRGDVLSSASDDIKFGKTEKPARDDTRQTTGQSSNEEKRVLRARPKRASPMLATREAAVSAGSNKTKEAKKDKQAKSAPKAKPMPKPPSKPPAPVQPKSRYNPDNLPVSAQRLFAVAPGIVECEACLKLFSQSSVQGHRRRLHGLKANQLACAHCELTFPTKKERHEHIRSSHPGKPVGVDAKTISQHKIYQYLCPCCKKVFSLIDLETHLAEAHSTTLDKVRSAVLWVCPFCPGGRSKKTFRDHHSLKFHCEEAHEECQLLGAILFVPGVSGKRYPETKKSRSRSPVPSSTIAEPPRRYYAKTEPAESDENASGEDNYVEENPFVLHRLSIKPLDLLNATTISRELLTSNPSTADILTTVNSTVEALEETIEASGSADEALEKEYSDEARLYTRTIRERAGKAESEKLEKEKYKATCDEQQMMWEYENRGKKRSANSLEEEALLSRPIKYEKRPAASAATGGCCVGEGCRLCDGTHASELITEAEMNEAEGDIGKVLPIPFGGAKASEGSMLIPMNQLLMPEIKEIDVDDYLADSDIEQEEKEEAKEKEKRPSRRKQKAEQALSEMGHLCRLRHTLSFVEEYNQDLLPAIQRNPKNYHV